MLIIVTTIPLVGAILLDIYNSWNRGDIVNIIRHSTVVGPFAGGILKVPKRFMLDLVHRVQCRSVRLMTYVQLTAGRSVLRS